MLELLIHGTKFGWRILYRTPNFPSSFASDLRRDDVNNNRITVGQHAYSISQVSEGCIFSKYICVWDGDRRAIGNLSFSFLLTKDKKLDSFEVKGLLDELSGLYWSQYVTEGELSNKQENWNLFESIVQKYESKIQKLPFDEIEVPLVGSGDAAAFLYYKDENQLLQYFESPHQKEYQYHKQVFLVSDSLNSLVENPLNVLRHNLKANLTGQIDLNNHKYRLIIPPLSESNIKIEVRSKDKTIYNNGFLRIKSEIEIIWTKPFHVSQSCTGNISELSSSFLTIDDINRTIKIKEVYLNAKKHTFRFNPVNEYKKPITDCEVILKCDKFNIDRKASNNEITLTAEEVSIGVNVFVKRHGFEYPIFQLKPQLEGNTILLEIPKNNIYNNDPGNPKGKGSGRRNLNIALICLVSIIILSLVIFYPEEKVDNSPKMTNVDGNILIRSKLEENLKKLKCNYEFKPSTIQKIFPFLFNENSENNIDKNANCEKIKLYISIFEDLKEGKIDSLRGLDYLRNSLGPADLIDTLDKGQKIKNYTAIKDTIDLDIILKFLRPPVNREQGVTDISTETKDFETKSEAPKEGATIEQVKNDKLEKELEEKFWSLIGTKDKPQKDNFDFLYKEYTTKKINNEITKYLKGICDKKDDFKKLAEIKYPERSYAAKEKKLDLLKTSTPEDDEDN